MHLPESISAEIDEHFASHFKKNSEDYIVVYGSSVYSSYNTTSDIDLFMVTHRPDRLALSSLVSFIKDMHIRHGRSLDEEVPFTNKVRYTNDELESAMQFGGFDIENSRIIVPPVRKEANFLQSPQIKARLALNSLTTPHVAIARNLSRYDTMHPRAHEAATLLAISLCGKEEFNTNDLLDALTTSKTGERGEMFLGYKTEYPSVSEYLSNVLMGGLERIAKNGVVKVSRDGYVIDANDFDPLKYMQSTSEVQ